MATRANLRRLWGISAILVAAVAGCTRLERGPASTIRAEAGYVAIGSSFAAGPGVTTLSDDSPLRCARSIDNYAHILARSLKLRLTDVSCSGATTEHILGKWGELQPQLDAANASTRLITITIGGNDVAFIGNLGSASCRSFPVPPPEAPGGKCPEARSVSEATWNQLDASMRRIAAEAHRRSPAARVVFVDYVQVLPREGVCPAVPLTAEQATASRATAVRLAALTARVADQTGSELFKASALSQDHDACSAEPWVNGFPQPGGPAFVPYHPNARGMSAIAGALEQFLKGRRSS